jgi:hypothetical protein
MDTEDREKNPLSLPGIEPRSPGRPVRSQTNVGCVFSKFLVHGVPDIWILHGYRAQKVQEPLP